MDIDPDTEESKYEIEAIINSDEVVQSLGEKKQFHRVHWKGYEDNEDTWEPEENLENAVDMITAYWKKSHATAKYTEAMISESSRFEHEMDWARQGHLDSYFYQSDTLSDVSYTTYGEIMGADFMDIYREFKVKGGKCKV